MDPEKEQYYLQIAMDRPDMLCSETPLDILEEASSDAEPTKFLEEFFAIGHHHWLANRLGRTIHLPKVEMDRAILVLWYRACVLNTDRILGREITDADKPLFSDEGLY